MPEDRGSEREGGGGSGQKTGSPPPVGPLSLAAIVAFGAGLGAFAWVVGVDAGAAASPSRLESLAAAMRAEGGAAADRTHAWLEEARRALTSPVPVILPVREDGTFPSDLLAAVGYRFRLWEGQVLEATVTGEAGVRYFTELYRLPVSEDADGAGSPIEGASSREIGLSGESGGAEPIFVAEADSAGALLEHEAASDGAYVLRVLPEPFGGGRYSVDIGVRAALTFPVADRGPGSVISEYGAPRDEGLRDHEGIDVYAPRGTSVVAVTRAMVSEVGTSGRGGNFVWLQDWSREKEIYYAHLESSFVTVGMVVEPGDEIGTVGNTGNAEATVPHLHFGIYDLERRPSDPLPYIAPASAHRMAASDSAP